MTLNAASRRGAQGARLRLLFSALWQSKAQEACMPPAQMRFPLLQGYAPDGKGPMPPIRSWITLAGILPMAVKSACAVRV